MIDKGNHLGLAQRRLPMLKSERSVWICSGKPIQAFEGGLTIPNQTDDSSPARVMDAKNSHGLCAVSPAFCSNALLGFRPESKWSQMDEQSIGVLWRRICTVAQPKTICARSDSEGSVLYAILLSSGRMLTYFISCPIKSTAKKDGSIQEPSFL